MVSVFNSNSKENRWMVEKRLPLLLHYNLISQVDYTLFIDELNSALIEVDYSTLKGRGAGSGSRAQALCSGIVQAIIDGQQNKNYTDSAGKTITIKKPYVDDWSAEGYIRWAISCGLLEYIKETDKCKITELGKQLADAEEDSAEEKEALSIALLSYPPVLRILNLLNAKDHQTKSKPTNKTDASMYAYNTMVDLSYDTTLAWDKEQRLDIVKYEKGRTNAYNLMNKTIKKGERYHLYYYHKGLSGGHIVTAFKDDDGEPVIYDPQSGESTKGKADIIDYFAYKTTHATMYRVDNLKFNFDVMNKIVKESK